MMMQQTNVAYQRSVIIRYTHISTHNLVIVHDVRSDHLDLAATQVLLLKTLLEQVQISARVHNCFLQMANAFWRRPARSFQTIRNYKSTMIARKDIGMQTRVVRIPRPPRTRSR